MKTCTLCKIQKPLDNFSRRGRKDTSLHAWCKPCLHSRKMEWRSRKPRPSRAFVGPKQPRPPRPKKIVPPEVIEARKQKEREMKQEWRNRNREAVNAKRRVRRKILADENPLIRLESAYRARILSAFKAKRIDKNSKTFNMLGCTPAQLKAHLESLFLPGMTWKNRGYEGWHVDHIIPLSSANSEEDLRKLCHYTNLQPLWAVDNMLKGAKMPEELTA